MRAATFLPRMTLATVAVTIVLAGCGGGDSPPPPAPVPAPEPATLSKADLISQGDGLCAEVNAAIASIRNSTTIAESDKANQVGDLYSGLADRIEKLGTPDDGEAPAEVIAALRELADPAGSGDPAAFQDAARTYGFTDCAGGPSAPVSPDTSGTGTSASPDPGQTYETPESAPAPAPAPAPDTGGVTPDAPSGGTAPPPAGGSGGSGTGGIGPG